MADSVKIIFDAVDNASGKMAGIRAGFSTFNNVLMGVEMAAQKVGQAIEVTVGETVKYANQIRDLQMISGMAAEESSRLIQVLDDFKINIDSLTPAIRKMTSEGLTPTIETLAQLSNAYNALGTPLEKNAFLMDKFGRAGLDMAEMMSKGGKAILEMGAAIDESLIMTQEGVDQAREYEIALDNWSDSVQGLKVSIGTGLLPVLTDLSNHVMAVMEADKQMQSEGLVPGSKAYMDRRQAIIEAIKAEQKQQAALMLASDAANTFADDVGELTEEELKLAAAIRQANSATLEGALGGIEDASGVYKTVVDAQDAYLKKSGEVYDMMAAGETVPPETLADLQKLKDEYDDARAANEQWWKKFIFTTTAAKLAASGGELTSEEFNLLLQIGQQFGMIDPAVAGAYADIFNAISTVDPSNTDEVYKLLKKIQAMDGMTLDIYATIHETTETETGGETGDGSCFTSDTPISRPGGQKDISEFAVGDPIYCYANGALIETTVEQVLIHPAAPRTILIIETARGIICVTPEHNLLIGGEWRRAESIVIGTNLTWEDGSPDAVIAITPSYYTDAVYNLHVKHESHSYIAGGFVVHNYKWDAPEGGTTDGSAPKTITNYGTINFILPKGYKMAGSMKV